MVGEVVVLVEPLDATVKLGGKRIDATGQSVPVLAGTWPLVVERPGFTSIEEDVEVRSGRSQTIDYALERLSAVARLRIRPIGASVLLDGAPAPIAERVEIPEADDEEELAIEGLAPGSHELRLELDGHRPLQLSFEVVELEDYSLTPARLDLMQGEVRLTGLPEGARVTVDSQVASPRRIGGDLASLLLPPGPHALAIAQPGVGGFRSEITLEDRQVLEVVVELRPTIAFLGVLGSDRLTAGDLAQRLGERLGTLEGWIWIDHSIGAAAALDDLGLSAEELRRVAALSGTAGAPEWPLIQTRFDSEFDASLYLVAVLGDDLYATTADIWLWSPGPWPAAPTRRQLPVSGDQELAELGATFDARPVPMHVQLGARFIDSEAGQGPLAATIITGGPAEAAALAVGDRVIELDGRSVASVSELLQSATARAGSTVGLRVGSTAVTRDVQLQPELQPGVISLTDPSLVEPLLAARLSLELLRPESDTPRWVLELNQAALLLRAQAFQDAVQLLRRIEAPATAGLGRAMVDYWLGTTLLSIDPSGYAQAARAAFARVLETPEARLYHADGPLLAPRARARLAELDRLAGN
jgi:hypothetical protein